MPLNSMCAHIADRMKYDTPLDAPNIAALIYDDVQEIHMHYQECPMMVLG